MEEGTGVGVAVKTGERKSNKNNNKNRMMRKCYRRGSEEKGCQTRKQDKEREKGKDGHPQRDKETKGQQRGKNEEG